MSTKLFLPNPTSQQRFRVGPLTCDIDGFAAQLAAEGYAHSSAKDKLRLIRELSSWLEHEGLGVEVLDEQRVRAFLVARGPRRTAQREATTCRQLLSYLRENDRIPAAPSSLRSDSAMGRMEQAYERFLVRERGLTAHSAEICHRFRCEGCHLIHTKPATHSGGKLPGVGAKRRGVWHC